MVICPCCYSHGYIQNPERQSCPRCGGFGFIKNEAEKDTNISSVLISSVRVGMKSNKTNRKGGAFQ
jgi:RecJ-like exonuclease